MALLFSVQQLMAQGWIEPVVEVHLDALSDQDANRLTGFSQQISTYLRSFRMTDASIDLVPIVPITYRVDVAMKEVIGTEYIADLRISAFRPIFEQDEETLIFIAYEPNIHIDYKPSQVYTYTDVGSIQDLFYLRLHYYTYIALALYYDSMDSYGGDPFWEVLQKKQAQYDMAWKSSANTALPPLHPQALLPEIFCEWGDRFRDLWFMYHLEAVDATDNPKRYSNLVFILGELAQLNSENHLYTLYQLLRDTKSTEIARLYGSMPQTNQAKAQPYISQLFPYTTALLK